MGSNGGASSKSINLRRRFEKTGSLVDNVLLGFPFTCIIWELP